MADPPRESVQDERYREAAGAFGAALERLARAYEPDPDTRRDLLQEIHVALWRSLARFDGRCSTRTWVYRVAHNTATSHALRRRRRTPALVSLDEAADAPDTRDGEREMDERRVLDRLLALVQRLTPIDRQVIVLYLEGVDAASIGEVTGLSPANVSTKVHRIKQLLVRRFHEGIRHGA
jgi:RNA polymerase sigma-70 factor (ECF subfamily)